VAANIEHLRHGISVYAISISGVTGGEKAARRYQHVAASKMAKINRVAAYQ